MAQSELPGTYKRKIEWIVQTDRDNYGDSDPDDPAYTKYTLKINDDLTFKLNIKEMNSIGVSKSSMNGLVRIVDNVFSFEKTDVETDSYDGEQHCAKITLSYDSSDGCLYITDTFDCFSTSDRRDSQKNIVEEELFKWDDDGEDSDEGDGDDQDSDDDEGKDDSDEGGQDDQDSDEES